MILIDYKDKNDYQYIKKKDDNSIIEEFIYNDQVTIIRHQNNEVIIDLFHETKYNDFVLIEMLKYVHICSDVDNFLHHYFRPAKLVCSDDKIESVEWYIHGDNHSFIVNEWIECNNMNWTTMSKNDFDIMWSCIL